MTTPTEAGTMPSEPTGPKPGERWRHYKGGEYTVLAVGRTESTLTPCVTYGDPSDAWVRPLADWLEVLDDGRPRFTRIASEPTGQTLRAPISVERWRALERVAGVVEHRGWMPERMAEAAADEFRQDIATLTRTADERYLAALADAQPLSDDERAEWYEKGRRAGKRAVGVNVGEGAQPEEVERAFTTIEQVRDAYFPGEQIDKLLPDDRWLWSREEVRALLLAIANRTRPLYRGRAPSGGEAKTGG